ncbi:MAG TPA: hypothetical protein VEI48_12190 [Candidatus Sulfotelmatobacter sp.]|nr:hypothetical protein [Candidatus Sulfotelmatobacter sp.]
MAPPVMTPAAAGRVVPEAPLSADAALALVGDRGVRLMEADPAARQAANLLLVALRREHHDRQFEPDWLLYWVAAAGRGVRRRLDRGSLEIGGAPFAWGTIRVFDRLSVFSTYVTFGGTITLGHASDGTLMAQFASPAPILRWTGRDQPPDVRAAEAECFFARIMVPIDFTSGAEALVAATSPLAVYAAMLADLEPRLAAERALDAPDARLAATVRHEALRVRASDPAAWQEGRALLVGLGLASA